MTNKRLLGILFAILFFATAAVAQNVQNPIKWRMTVKMTSPDTGVVTLRAIVPAGWHLYGTSLPKNGPVPTTFNFDKSTGVEFTEDFVPSTKPVTKKDEMFDLTLTQWESNVTFTRRFKLKGDVRNAVIDGSVRYMGCNDQNCLPPSTQNFKTNVKPYAK